LGSLNKAKRWKLVRKPSRDGGKEWGGLLCLRTRVALWDNRSLVKRKNEGRANFHRTVTTGNKELRTASNYIEGLDGEIKWRTQHKSGAGQRDNRKQAALG